MGSGRATDAGKVGVGRQCCRMGRTHSCAGGSLASRRLAVVDTADHWLHLDTAHDIRWRLLLLLLLPLLDSHLLLGMGSLLSSLVSDKLAILAATQPLADVILGFLQVQRPLLVQGDLNA